MSKKLTINNVNVEQINDYYINRFNNVHITLPEKRVKVEYWHYDKQRIADGVDGGVLASKDSLPNLKKPYKINKDNAIQYNKALTGTINTMGIEFGSIEYIFNLLEGLDTIDTGTVEHTEEGLKKLCESSSIIFQPLMYYSIYYFFVGEYDSISFLFCGKNPEALSSGDIVLINFDTISSDDFLTKSKEDLIGRPIYFSYYDSGAKQIVDTIQLLNASLYQRILAIIKNNNFDIKKQIIAPMLLSQLVATGRTFVPTAKEEGNYAYLYYSLSSDNIFPIGWVTSKTSGLKDVSKAPICTLTNQKITQEVFYAPDNITAADFDVSAITDHVYGYYDAETGEVVNKEPVGYEYYPAQTKEEDSILAIQVKPQCLSGDTLIETNQGLVYINKINETELVNNEKILYTDAKENKKASQYIIYQFSDGSILKIIRDHRIWSVKKKRFCHISTFKLGEYTINNKGEKIALISKTLKVEPIYHYTLFTENKNQYYANGILCGNIFSNIRINWLRKIMVKIYTNLIKKG